MKIQRIGLSFRSSLRSLSSVRKIVHHHMAHESADIQTVHRWHLNNGWAGIGYNYWIAFDGTIYEGRGERQGAHVAGHNSNTTGIGYQGNFTRQQMTDAQLKAGIGLAAFLCRKYGLSASDNIGHNALAVTACPGRNFRMSELRSGIDAVLNGKSDSKDTPQTGQGGGNELPVHSRSVLRRGMRGTDVLALQKQLIELGYEINPHGSYGSQLENRVKDFQKGAGITVDGVAGPQTFGAIKKALNPTPKLTLPSGVYRRGSRGEEVRQIQKALDAVYFRPGAIDGVYGAKTEDAVRRFQSVHLPREVDGVYGSNTRRALQKEMNKRGV